MTANLQELLQILTANPAGIPTNFDSKFAGIPTNFDSKFAEIPTNLTANLQKFLQNLENFKAIKGLHVDPFICFLYCLKNTVEDFYTTGVRTPKRISLSALADIYPTQQNPYSISHLLIGTVTTQ